MIMSNPTSGTEPLGESQPWFGPGDIVRHQRYGYRGVVVSVDTRCKADDAWYEKNQTQPEQNQPWYHVLVDGATSTTYAAQQNLARDTSREPVDHPLVNYFFNDFWDGQYVRNNRPWPPS